MSSSLSTSSAINWTKPFLKNQPLAFSNMEPALTTANMVLQSIMNAPFRWRWNRATFSFPTVPANTTATPPVIPQCDYTLSLPDFGFLEDQWLTDAATGKVMPLSGAFSLPMATGDAARPTAIAAQREDGLGNITFRTKEMPNKVYTISGEYQRKPPILTSIGTVIAPVPDEFGFIFLWGFLTIAGMLVNDARVVWWEKNFLNRLLGVQGGLSDVDRNIFLGLWSANIRTLTAAQMGAQQSMGARAGAQ